MTEYKLKRLELSETSFRDLIHTMVKAVCDLGNEFTAYDITKTAREVVGEAVRISYISVCSLVHSIMKLEAFDYKIEGSGVFIKYVPNASNKTLKFVFEDSAQHSSLIGSEASYIPKSSVINQAKYNFETGDLRILFKNPSIDPYINTWYVYKDVPQSVWDNFCLSESAGKYFHNNIKGFYTWIQSK